MQTLQIARWLKISKPKPLSTLFSSLPLQSNSNSIAKFLPNHPILPLLEQAQNHLLDLRVLHGHAITSNLISDPFAASRIIQFFLQSKSPNLRHAAALFNSLENPDVYTWNAMIAGATNLGSPRDSIAYYFRMRLNNAPPNTYTFALLVKACIVGGTNGWIGTGREVHGQTLKCGVEQLIVIKNSLLRMYCNMGLLKDAHLLFESGSNLDLISWNTLISAYGKNGGDVGIARSLFEKMPRRSLVSWTALIDGYVRHGDFVEALRLFHGLQAEGIKPDVVTLASVLKACAHLGALDQGRSIHIFIEENNLVRDGNVILETALVDMYCKCGCIDEAVEVFDKVRDDDIVLWNAMIGGFAMNGDSERAIELFKRMNGRVAPNESTYIAVLCACTHAGMVHKGIELFETMKENGIELKREHYGCLADLMGRAGRVQEAEEVLLTMPMEPEASQWGALMSACRTHKDIEVGERVGRRLIELEPLDGGRYVLLANLYAAVGRWNEARELRREMEEKGARKETGCSLMSE